MSDTFSEVREGPSATIVWTVPQDVTDEWKRLSPEELVSIYTIVNSLLEEVDNTLAVVSINTELLPLAAQRMRESLKKFRLSLADLPLPQGVSTRKH